MSYLSFSKLESYSSCQRRFWLEQHDPVQEPPDRTAAFALGRQVHSAMERVARAAQAASLSGKPFSYDEEVDRLEFDMPAGPLSLETLQDYARPGVELLKTLNNPPSEWIELKRKDPRILNSGRIDLVVANSPGPAGPEPRQCVIDWKTGRARYTDNNVRKSVQLGLYCYMLGLRDAAFVYLDGVGANVVYANFTDAEIADSVRWFTENSKAIHLQEPLGMAGFAMTGRDNFLCSPRFCPYYERVCYGKTDGE